MPCIFIVKNNFIITLELSNGKFANCFAMPNICLQTVIE